MKIYVDNFLIYNNCIKLRNWFKEQFKKHEIKDLEVTSYYLLIKIEHDKAKESISWSQTQYMKSTIYESHPVTAQLNKYYQKFSYTMKIILRMKMFHYLSGSSWDQAV